MDILLIHPNAAVKIYQNLSKISAIEPPIWCALIATFLRNNGFDVAILDCEAEGLSPKEAGYRARSYSPRVYCVVVYGQQPSASTQNMVGAISLMHELKDVEKPRVYVGPHPSALPRRTIEDDDGAFVAVGEGPYTLKRLLELPDYDDLWLRSVPGLWYRNNDGEIVSNPPAPLIKDLDNELPRMALDLLPLDKYRTSNWHGWTNGRQTMPFISLYTSLGCPFHCTFCMINAPFNQGASANNTFRYWSPEHTLKTIDYFADLGITNIKIADEMFVYKPAHFLHLCELIHKRGHKLNFWAYARVDTTRKEYLTALKKAGVNWLGLGIESGDASIRREVTKGRFGDTDIRKIVCDISDADICTTGNYIFGLPSDTLQSMQRTLDLAMELPTDFVNFYCAMAYPGSVLHRDISYSNPSVLPEYPGNPGWIGYSQHAFESFPLPSKSLNNSTILKFRDDAFVKFFSNPSYIERMTSKFGSTFTEELSKMLSFRLKRQLYA